MEPDPLRLLAARCMPTGGASPGNPAALLDAGFFSVDSSRCISTDVFVFVREEILVSANKFRVTFRSVW